MYMSRRISYIKRCLHPACPNRQECEHGKAQMRFLQLFPEGISNIPLNMLGMFRCIYPVAKGCKRYQMTKEQLLVLQDKQENKLLITTNNR